MPTTIIAVAIIGILVAGALWLHARSNTRMAAQHMAGRPAVTPQAFGAAFFPAEQAIVAARLRELLAEETDVGLERMRPDDNLVKDLRIDELDSLALAQFVAAVEREYQIQLPEADLRRMRTLREVVAAVHGQLAGRGTA